MMRFGSLINTTHGYEAGHIITWLYSNVGGQLFIQPLEETRLRSKHGTFLPTFQWSAKKFIVPGSAVKSMLFDELSPYIRRRLGRPYLITMGKTPYLYLYNGVRDVTDGRVLHYSTLYLNTETYEWVKDARDITSNMQFLDRDLTDEETSLIAIANLQMTDDI